MITSGDGCVRRIPAHAPLRRRSAQISVDYADPAATRTHVRALAAAGFRHVVLALPRPYPDHAARWLVDEIATPVRETAA
jgi:hypothetical protein